MRTIGRFLAGVLLCIGLAAAPAAAQDDAPGGDDNAAVAVNTQDGGSVFRLAFSIRQVSNGVVDQTNAAYALASCTDCQTVALAFQVVLVRGDADVVVPENTAVAYNEACVECLTYASATQIVLGVDGPVHLTADGRQRLAELYRSLRDLEEQVATMSVADLHGAVTAAKEELIAILSEELVPAGASGSAPNNPSTTSTTSTTAPDGTTTTTTEATTSTTETTETTTTSTTVESPSTTSTSTP
jgi:putative peptide zinc metalloprotease protein